MGVGTGPSVGGLRPEDNNYTIEGIDNNNKGVTGPLVYVPNDATGEFTAIVNQFSPEFGHSAGGQFNTTVRGGTNKIHGMAYEYFQNRNLNAENAIQGGKIPNPRYDNNRYGAQVGGPIKKDKLFYFANFERQSIGQNSQGHICVPTSAGMATLNSKGWFNATNLGVYTKYSPVADTQVDDQSDLACFNEASGPQYMTVYSDTTYNSAGPDYAGNTGLGGVFGSADPTKIPLGNFLLIAPDRTNIDVLTTSADWTISAKDSFRGRYIYNKWTGVDTLATLPAFHQPLPQRYHIIALSEYHNFTPNLINEARLGFNRFYQDYAVGNVKFPGLDSFPNVYLYDQGFIDIGPDDNAPQSTVQNLYQLTDNLSWVKGKHSLKFGFDGRKFIAPQTFTQRGRGDYEWDYITEYLHDLAPTAFGERSTAQTSTTATRPPSTATSTTPGALVRSSASTSACGMSSPRSPLVSAPSNSTSQPARRDWSPSLRPSPKRRTSSRAWESTTPSTPTPPFALASVPPATSSTITSVSCRFTAAVRVNQRRWLGRPRSPGLR